MRRYRCRMACATHWRTATRSSGSSGAAPGWLRVDPTFDPLRKQPAVQEAGGRNGLSRGLPLQDEAHPDISSPDSLHGLVHSSERHDIDDCLDAMLRRKLEHLMVSARLPI